VAKFNFRLQYSIGYFESLYFGIAFLRSSRLEFSVQSNFENYPTYRQILHLPSSEWRFQMFVFLIVTLFFKLVIL
jgi:hypothetical protein